MSDPSGDLDSSTPNEDAAALRFRAGIERMRRRWPAIAEAADHPLTEWVVERQERLHGTTPRRYSAYVLVIMAIQAALSASIFTLLLFALDRYVRPALLGGTPTRLDAKLYLLTLLAPVAVIPLSRLEQFLSTDRHLRWSLMGPAARAFREDWLKRFGQGSGEAMSWPDDVWLTPLSFKQAAAIAAATLYLRRRKRRSQIALGAIWTVAGCVVVAWAAVWAYDPKYGALPGLLSAFALGTGLAAAWFSVVLLIDDIEMRIEFWKIWEGLIQKAPGQSRRRLGRRTLFLAALALSVIALSWIGVLLWGSGSSFYSSLRGLGKGWGIPGFPQYLLAVMMWLAAILVILASKSFVASRTLRRFQRLAAMGDRILEHEVHLRHEGI